MLRHTAHEMKMLGLPAPVGFRVGQEARSHQHLRGCATLRRFGDAQLRFFHEARLVDALDAQTALGRGYVSPDRGVCAAPWTNYNFSLSIARRRRSACPQSPDPLINKNEIRIQRRR